MARLVILTDRLEGSSHELSGDKTTIGRADGNVFQIIKPSISGRHCEILLRGNDVVVRDLQSTNGTFIQGGKITEAALKPGQVLRLGQVDLRLEASAPAVAPKSGGPLPSAPKTTDLTAVPNMPIARAAVPPDGSSSVPPGKIESPAAARPGGAVESENPPAGRHQVLFVDDSVEFLEAITELYAILGDKTWEIHRAFTADQALAALQQKMIDLVVLDIGMPVLDGMQLLTLIHRRYPEVKKAILTSSAAAGDRAACLDSGAELFIQKPVSNQG